MGGGIRSKFKFPVPGRSSKKQQVPTVSVSSPPLSKAQRILGADGINTGSLQVPVDPGRAWETGSTGGISISISESSAGQHANNIGFDEENEGEADHVKGLWEEESAIIPRQIRSAHGLTPKRTIFTAGNESRENVTNTSARGRRLSSSTIDTHYDSKKMPLAISQQTSNSAMAKGFSSKVNELLDMDGTLAGPQTGKKKPSRLDFSRLRPKAHRDRNKKATNIEPVLANNYSTPSLSFMSQSIESPISSFTSDDRQRNPRRLMKQHSATESPQPMQISPRSKGVTEASGLNQLYHHYEQMSFRDEYTFGGEIDPELIPAFSERSSHNLRPASSFTQSLLAPPPLPLYRGHTRDSSQDSKELASIADSSGGLQVNSTSRKDYAGSVSSRHTRTSKGASGTSIVESDRLVSSVLSLSDSSDDEAMESSSPAAPVSRRGSLTLGAITEDLSPGRGQQSPNYPHGTTNSRKFIPSLNQLDEHSTVKSSSNSQNTYNHSPSNNTSRSSHSSMSTITPAHFLPPSAPDSRPSPRLSPRAPPPLDTLGASRPTGYGMQETKAVPFVPPISTSEAALKVSMSGSTNNLLRQNSTATSRFSQSSDPISPSSVEFYVKSRESLQRDGMPGGSAEAHNARLMAVTKQEEMLLAALRQKRAKMRGTAISETEEDGKSHSSRSNRGSFASSKRSNTTSSMKAPREMPIPEQPSNPTKSWPKRASSLFVGVSRENLRENARQNGKHKDQHDVEMPSAASRSDATEGNTTSATGSISSTTNDSPNDKVLLYLDQPIGDKETEDFSDYGDDSDGEDLVVNERRTSRMKSRRDSISGHKAGLMVSRRESSHLSLQYRKDSIPTSNRFGAPSNRNRLQDVPEVEPLPKCNEDVDADDAEDDVLDDFPQPPMPPPNWPLPPRPDQSTAKPGHSASPSLLHPSHAMVTRQTRSPEPIPDHLMSKKSLLRLSAVGQVYSPMPFWGDDD